MTFIDAIANWIADRIVPYPDGSNAIPLPDEPTKKRTTQPTKKIDDDVTYNKVAQNFVRHKADKPNQVFSWEVVKTIEQADITKQRVGDITDKDRQELANRNLDLDKALIIKPYWVKKNGRQDAAKMIDQKGIYQSLIGQYYAAFAAANGDVE